MRHSSSYGQADCVGQADASLSAIPLSSERRKNVDRRKMPSLGTAYSWRNSDGETYAVHRRMETKNTVYILRSESNHSRHYTGLTSNLERRLKSHNAGQNVDSARDRPWSLVVAFHFADERVARRFERYLKSGSGREFAKRHFAETPIT